MKIAAAGGPVQNTGIALDGDEASISPDGSHVALTKSQRKRELLAIDVPSL